MAQWWGWEESTACEGSQVRCGRFRVCLEGRAHNLLRTFEGVRAGGAGCRVMWPEPL